MRHMSEPVYEGAGSGISEHTSAERRGKVTSSNQFVDEAHERLEVAIDIKHTQRLVG